MNKIFKYGSAVIAAVMAMVLGSCTEEYEYSRATAEGQQVYFSSALASKIELKQNETSFTVPINRLKTDEAISVNLTLTDETGIFTLAQPKVDFAEGKDEATITVNYDAAQLEYDDFKGVVISIADEEYKTPYGLSQFGFTAGIAAPFKSLGKGRFGDSYLVNGTVEVEIFQGIDNPNLFRIMHPYDEIAELFASDGFNCSGDQSEYMEIEVLQPGDRLGNVTVSQSDLIYFKPTNTGIDLYELGASVEVWHPAHFGQPESGWVNNRVAEWQDELPGIIEIAPAYYVPSAEQGSLKFDAPTIFILFPGYNPVDYSVALTYDGLFIGKDENTYAIGNAVLGSDVEEAKLAVVEGSNPEEALNAVLGGEVETTTITESGSVKIKCPYTGDCTMIAVTYAEGEVQDYATVKFTVNAGGSREWKSLGTGYYTDHIVRALLIDAQGNPASPIKYPVEVQESMKTPGVYRLLHPYAPGTYGYLVDGLYDTTGDYNLIINAGDPDAVYIQKQPSGFVVPQIGNIYCMTMGGGYIDAGADLELIKERGLVKGKMKDGVIIFEPKELLYALDSEPDYVFPVNNYLAEVLVLPSAANASDKAAAAKADSKKATLNTSAAKNNIKKVNRRSLMYKFTQPLYAPYASKLK